MMTAVYKCLTCGAPLFHFGYCLECEQDRETYTRSCWIPYILAWYARVGIRLAFVGAAVLGVFLMGCYWFATHHHAGMK